MCLCFVKAWQLHFSSIRFSKTSFWQTPKDPEFCSQTRLQSSQPLAHHTLLQKLHWLLIVPRIQYKVATLCYNSFTERYPLCFSELRFAPFLTQNLSDTFHKNKDLWATSFFTFFFSFLFFTGLTQWNSSPYDILHSASASSLKLALKIHLFKSAYD